MRLYHPLTLLFLPLLLVACSGTSTTNGPISLSNTHIHGLAVDRADSSRVYIATHNGTFVLTNDKDLAIVGRAKDDYMGFSPHPTNGTVLFSSGHPQGGGNLGVQRSDDDGQTWTHLSDGDPSGPVDFHSMTVSEANPDLLYGWYHGKVYRSVDGGKTWEALPSSVPPVVSFTTDPRDANVVYAGTLKGILKSTNRGETWVSMPEFENDSLVDMEADPQNGTIIVASEKRGIVRMGPGSEGGIVIENVGTFPDGNIPSQIAVDRKNPQVFYAAVEHMIYKSTDSGKTWKKIL